MNPHSGARRLCQLIRNEDVARELDLRAEVLKTDVSFEWLARNIERGLGFPKAFQVEAVEGADAVAVLLANEQIVYEIRRIFSNSTGTDPLGALKVLQRAAAQAPQSTRTIHQTADKLMQEIAARNPTSNALTFGDGGEVPGSIPHVEGQLGRPQAPPAPPGTTVVGVNQGLNTPPPENGSSGSPVTEVVDDSAIRAALDAGDIEALRALLG